MILICERKSLEVCALFRKQRVDGKQWLVGIAHVFCFIFFPPSRDFSKPSCLVIHVCAGFTFITFLTKIKYFSFFLFPTSFVYFPPPSYISFLFSQFSYTSTLLKITWVFLAISRYCIYLYTPPFYLQFSLFFKKKLEESSINHGLKYGATECPFLYKAVKIK